MVETKKRGGLSWMAKHKPLGKKMYGDCSIDGADMTEWFSTEEIISAVEGLKKEINEQWFNDTPKSKEKDLLYAKIGKLVDYWLLEGKK